jgi:hypothetical protein
MFYHFGLIEHFSKSGGAYSLFYVSFITPLEAFVPLAASHNLKGNTKLLDFEKMEIFLKCNYFTK